MTGHLLQNAPENHPLRKAYQLYNNLANRESWDQTTVLLAALPGEMLSKYLDISAQGVVGVDQNGNNTWIPAENGPHRFVIQNTKTFDIAHLIDDLMLSVTHVTP